MRRASSLYDGRRRARESDPAEVGGDGNNNGDKSCPLFPLLRLALCRGCYGRNHMAGKKKLFPGESGKYPGGGGKKLKSKTLDNCTGHCSTVSVKKFRFQYCK